MGRYSLTSAWLRRKRLERGIPSAVALARAARLTVSHIATLERGEVQPRPETFRRIAAALNLTQQERREFQRLAAADRLPDEPPELQRWVYLPACLLSVDHKDVLPFEVIVDDWIADSVPAAGSFLSWLALRARSPLPKEIGNLRAVAQSVFDESVRMGQEDPTWGRSDPHFAAADVASMLPSAWRNEVFRSRQKTAHLAGLLSRWVYWPRFLGSTYWGASLKDARLDFECSFIHVTPRFAVSVHDAIIAHRLWSLLNLTATFGVSGVSVQERTLMNQLGSPRGDLYVLLNTPPADLKATPFNPKIPFDFDRDQRRLDYLHAAERLDIALRLYEEPDLAQRILHTPRAQVEAALTRAVGLVGGLSIRFPDPHADPQSGKSSIP